MESSTTGEPAPENPDPDHNQSQSAQSQARTYECSFCKRGFSNAQALGGHMNIHRKDKDKAKKLKHHHLSNPPPPPNQQFRLDISSNTLTTPSFPPLEKFIKSEFVEDQKPTNKQPNWDFSTQDDSGATSRDQTNAQIHCCDDGFLEAELDLELRLGHEPTQSNTIMGTRKFF